jgi:hypothetical protein
MLSGLMGPKISSGLWSSCSRRAERISGDCAHWGAEDLGRSSSSESEYLSRYEGKGKEREREARRRRQYLKLTHEEDGK